MKSLLSIWNAGFFSFYTRPVFSAKDCSESAAKSERDGLQGAERLCDLLTICKAAAFKAALFVLMDKQQMDSEGFKK